LKTCKAYNIFQRKTQKYLKNISEGNGKSLRRYKYFGKEKLKFLEYF
jgi:hypothetical protein